MVMDQMGGHQLFHHLTNGLASVSNSLNSSTNNLPSTSALQFYATAAAASNLCIPPWAPFLQLPTINAGLFGGDPSVFMTRQRLRSSPSGQTADSALINTSAPVGAAQQHPINVISNVLPFCNNIIKAQQTSKASASVAAIIAATTSTAYQLQDQQLQSQQPFNLNFQMTNFQHAKHNIPQGPQADGNESNNGK